MPSNFTPNYQLNQWEADDRVLRVDFNADNAKLDAAIKAQADGLAAEKRALSAEKAAREAAVKAESDAREALAAELRPRAGAQLIADVTLEEDEPSAHVIPMSGFNWNEWLAVIITVDLITPSGSYGDIHFYINDTQAGSLFFNQVFATPEERTAETFMLFPFFDERNYVRSWPMTAYTFNAEQRINTIRFRDITKFKISSGGAIGKSTAYKIWGLR